MNWKWVKYCFKQTWRDFSFRSPATISILLFFALSIFSWNFILLSKWALSDSLSFLNYFAILFTFIAILWNTLETGKLKRLQKKQISLAIRPLLVLEYRHVNQWNLCVRNIGQGAALNIHIYYPSVLNDDGQKVEYAFELSNNIISNEEIAVVSVNHKIFNMRGGCSSQGDRGFNFANPGISTHDYEVEYMDVEKNIYRSVFQIKDKKFVFIDCIEL